MNLTKEKLKWINERIKMMELSKTILRDLIDIQQTKKEENKINYYNYMTLKVENKIKDLEKEKKEMECK